MVHARPGSTPELHPHTRPETVLHHSELKNSCSQSEISQPGPNPTLKVAADTWALVAFWNSQRPLSASFLPTPFPTLARLIDTSLGMAWFQGQTQSSTLLKTDLKGAGHYPKPPCKALTCPGPRGFPADLAQTRAQRRKSLGRELSLDQ